MTHEFSEGLTCCSCASVLFSVDAVISHAVKNPGHKYYKWGKGEGVLFIKPMVEYQLAEKHWDFTGDEKENTGTEPQTKK